MRESLPPVVCCGEILIDLIAADHAESLLETSMLAVQPGGAPANVAVGLARLGTPSRFCGVVGDDPFGERLRRTLERESVDTSAVRTATQADTTIAFAWRDAAGDGHFRVQRHADLLLSPEDIDRANIENSAALVVGSVSLAAEPSASAILHAIEVAGRSAVGVCADVNIRPSLWPDQKSIKAACEPLLEPACLIKLSLDDARYLGLDSNDPLSVVRSMAQYDGQFVVVTDGARGAWAGYRLGGRMHCLPHIPAFRVDAVDPTGAGDACMAALVRQFMRRGWIDLQESDVRFASAAGALATTRHGAMTALPTVAAIQALMSSASKGR